MRRLSAIWPKRVFLGLIVIAVLVGSKFATAQPAPDPSLWNVVLNPSGQQVVPVVFYDPMTGMLSLDTRGLNRIDDTPDYTTVGGPIGHDDVGLIGLFVQTPVQGGIVQAPFTGLHIMQNINWASAYFGGNYVTAGGPLTNLGNQFLWPGIYPYVQLPVGLTGSDFGEVEVIVNFDVNTPGGVGIESVSNGVQIVPEPATLTAPFFLPVLAWFRRSRGVRRSSK